MQGLPTLLEGLLRLSDAVREPFGSGVPVLDYTKIPNTDRHLAMHTFATTFFVCSTWQLRKCAHNTWYSQKVCM